MANQIQRINAKYILPITAPVIQKGSILIENGIIKFIGRENDCPNNAPCQVSHYPDHLLMPGLVNAHTHLSLSHVKNKIKAGTPFTDWIREIISCNNSMTEFEEKDAIKKGIKNLVATGSTTIGDISRSGFSVEVMQNMKIRGIVFLEIIGFKKSMKNDEMHRINQLLKSFKTNGLVRCGLSPHSPYSVAPQLIQSAYRLAKADKILLSMHIAETIEELKFIEKREGPLRQLLEDMDKWDPEWKPQKTSPIKYLESLEVLKGITAIHLSHINDEDVKIVKKNNMSVVCCANSNRWFQREQIYPLEKLLKNRINVALGTDSLASNEALNMFEELNLIRKLFPMIKDKTLLNMATINGARALGLESETGSLKKGKKADIIGLKINSSDNIYNSILSSKGEISFSMVDGRIIFPF